MQHLRLTRGWAPPATQESVNCIFVWGGKDLRNVQHKLERFASPLVKRSARNALDPGFEPQVDRGPGVEGRLPIHVSIYLSIYLYIYLYFSPRIWVGQRKVAAGGAHVRGSLRDDHNSNNNSNNDNNSNNNTRHIINH